MNAVAKSTVALVATGYTATGLADALLRATDAPDSTEAQTRLQAIVNGLTALPLTDARHLLTEAVKVNEKCKTQASQARQIIGAVKLVLGFADKLQGIGWHKAVSAARAALEAAGITASGGKVKSDEEKALDKLMDNARDVQKAEMATNPEAAMKKTLQEFAQQAAQKSAEMDATNMAERIHKAKGGGFCILLAEALQERATRPVAEEQPKG